MSAATMKFRDGAWKAMLPAVGAILMLVPGTAFAGDPPAGPPDGDMSALPAQPARTWSTTRGAEILPAGGGALEIRGGMPSAGIQFDFPVLSIMEVSPHISYNYLWYMSRDVIEWGGDEPAWLNVYHGLNLGVLLKFRLFQRGGHAVSLAMDTSFLYATHGRGYQGYGASFCSIDVRYSHRWNSPRIAVIAGFRMPYWIWDGQSSVPLLAQAGFEFNAAPHLNVHLMVEGGVAITGDLYEEEWFFGPAIGGQAGISVVW